MRRCRDLLLALFLLVPLGAPVARQLVQAAPADFQIERWTQTSIDDWATASANGLLISNNAGGEIRLAQAQESGLLIAEPHSVSFAFTALTATLDADIPVATTVALEIRLSVDGVSWDEWRLLGGQAGDGPLLLDTAASWLQYRISLQSQAPPASPVVNELSFTFLNPADGPRLADISQRQPLLGGPPTLTSRPRVITPEIWGGAPERQRGLSPRPRRVRLLTLPAAGDPLVQLRLMQGLSTAGLLPFAFAVDQAGNLIQTRRSIAGQDGTVELAFLGEPGGQSRQTMASLLAWLGEAYRLPGAALEIADQTSTTLRDELTRAAASETVRGRWIFPEGNTRDYIERIMLFNPGTNDARARLIAYPGGNASSSEVLVPAGARINVTVNDIFSDISDLPIEVVADHPLVAEQTLLFGHDALNAPGIASASRAWYFAEGSGEPGVDTYLLLFNPQDEEVAAEIQLMGTEGVSATQRLAIGPHSRYVYQASSALGQGFGARVVASRPIVAARTMRFAGGGGHLSNGAPAPSRSWYFAEGTTEAPYTTTLTLLNPNPQRTSVTLTIFSADGTALARSYAIAGESRVALNLRDLAPSLGVAISISAARPIVAERTMLFNDGRSGTNSLGAPQLSYVWHFAEGRTAAPASETLLLANPNDRPARVRIVISAGGELIRQTVTVARHSRTLIPLGELAPEQESHATSVFSNIPIVAERTIMIDNDEGGGGHTSVGVPGR